MEAKVRTIISDLESKLKAMVGMSKPVGIWMVRWAGGVLTKYAAGRDGETAWQRRCGQECFKHIAHVGGRSAISSIANGNYTADKDEPTVFEGIWLGTNACTGEVLIRTKEGVI